MKPILILGFSLIVLVLGACAQVPLRESQLPAGSPTPVPVNSPAPKPSIPTASRLLLEFKRKGGLAGFCDTLRITAGGPYTYSNECKGTSHSGQLSAGQASVLNEFITRLRPFSYRDEPSPLPPDYIVTTFTLNGTGNGQESNTDIELIKTFAASIMNTLAASALPTASASSPTSAVTGTLVYTREGNRLFGRDLATNREWLITEAMRDYDYTENGRRIVMVDPIESGPMGSIRLTNLDGTNAIKLTSSLNDMHPRWSPDATRILFERNVLMDDARNFVLSAEVWVMNADGSTQLKLADGFDAEWSPDGKRIAYVTNPVLKGKTTADTFGYKQNAVGLMNASGENKWTPVTTQTKSANFTVLQWNMGLARLVDLPRWSPEGNEITFRVLDTHTTFLTTDATRGGITSFVWLEFDNLARGFSYSPNGKYITIGLGGNSGYSTLGVFNRTDAGVTGYSSQSKIAEFGAVPRASGQVGSNVLGFAWSPDGESLAYVLSSGEGKRPASFALWTAAANGQNARLVVQDARAPLLWVR